MLPMRLLDALPANPWRVLVRLATNQTAGWMLVADFLLLKDTDVLALNILNGDNHDRQD